MKERLIELMRQAYEKNINLLDFEKDILADYLLANGVIVPPCKVGDTMNEVMNPPHIKPYFIVSRVCAVHIADGTRNSCNHKRESYFLAECPNTRYVKKYPLSKIGKTVFLTKEEAEQALRKEDEGK